MCLAMVLFLYVQIVKCKSEFGLLKMSKREPYACLIQCIFMGIVESWFCGWLLFFSKTVFKKMFFCIVCYPFVFVALLPKKQGAIHIVSYKSDILWPAGHISLQVVPVQPAVAGIGGGGQGIMGIGWMGCWQHWKGLGSRGGVSALAAFHNGSSFSCAPLGKLISKPCSRWPLKIILIVKEQISAVVSKEW